MSCQRIDLDFSSEPVDLHCPVCGALIFLAGEKQETCRHLLFWAESESGEWELTDKTLQLLFEARAQHLYKGAIDKGFYGSLDDFYATMKSSKAAEISATVSTAKSTILFCVSTSDIGCGGMHNGTFYALFDYLSGREQCRLFSSIES
jgi:hypothetical protein